MGETNSPSVAHVGYDISPLWRVKFNSLAWRNIVSHGQLKENLYIYHTRGEHANHYATDMVLLIDVTT
jgi:hypothetical protein